MDIGIIGAGKARCSIGKCMRECGLPVAGYFSRSAESSEEIGTFTDTKAFQNLKDIIKLLQHKIICHFSGSLSSAVFSGIVHPMYAFSDKFTYRQLNTVIFTMEGNEVIVSGDRIGDQER